MRICVAAAVQNVDRVAQIEALLPEKPCTPAPLTA